MYCPNCGTLRENNASFCGECGYKFEKEFKENIQNAINITNKDDKKNYKKYDTDIIFCPDCGTKNYIYREYCIDCGNKLSKYISTDDNSNDETHIKTYTCPKCETKNNINNTFCLKCGYNLKQTNEIKSDIKICNKCGAKYSKDDKFCSKCGNLLDDSMNNFNEYPVIININKNEEDDIDDSYSRRCPYCGSKIRSLTQLKCPHCGEWLRTSHFGCGSFLMVLTIILGIYLCSINATVGSISGIFLFLVSFFYFLPSVIAESRGHSMQSAIFILNLLLGWTVIGWIISLLLAFTGRRR